jgi:osmoprotectant transport system substrate-binding protein
MRRTRAGVVGAIALLLLMVMGACGDSGDDTNGNVGASGEETEETQPKGNLTVASFNFSESQILANLYAKALEAKGYTVTVKDKLGAREVVFPALEKGEIDIVPEYVGTLLEFLAKPASEATADVNASLQKLRTRLEAKNLTALDPADAIDANAIVVTKATAEKHKLTKVSDLAAVDDQLTFGGPPECPTRPLCLLGLKEKYGLEFKQVEKLDVGGPITREALTRGSIDVALLFSSDGAIARQGLVALQDDKGLQPAENVVPVVRTDKVDDDLREALNAISEKLTTAELVKLNAAVDIDKEDAADVAERWLKENDLL